MITLVDIGELCIDKLKLQNINVGSDILHLHK